MLSLVQTHTGLRGFPWRLGQKAHAGAVRANPFLDEVLPLDVLTPKLFRPFVHFRPNDNSLVSMVVEHLSYDFCPEANLDSLVSFVLEYHAQFEHLFDPRVNLFHMRVQILNAA